MEAKLYRIPIGETSIDRAKWIFINPAHVVAILPPLSHIPSSMECQLSLVDGSTFPVLIGMDRLRAFLGFSEITGFLQDDPEHPCKKGYHEFPSYGGLYVSPCNHCGALNKSPHDS